MKATEAKLLVFLQKAPQFIIPIYQRTYSWTEDECRQLWSDILRAGSNDAIGVHFMRIRWAMVVRHDRHCLLAGALRPTSTGLSLRST